jgi:trimeric autotransporter adhesin
MKNVIKFFVLSFLGFNAMAQNSITTPTGIPLTIGNNGVKLVNLTSASTPTAANNVALSVNATGDLILVPSLSALPNPITTGSGIPLTIGNNGVRLANLTSASTPSAANSLGLSVNATGDLILVPSLSAIPTTITTSIINTASGALTIGNNGVKLGNLTSASATSASNSKALSVDATGNIILVPAGSGGDPNFKVVNASNTLSGVGAGQLLNNAGAAALGTSNLFLGNNAGYNAGLTALSKENTFIGTNAGFNNTDGNNNAFLGIGAGVYNTLGNYNTFLGVNSGGNNRTGSNNMALGLNAGYDGIGTVAKNFNYSVFIGNAAGAKTSQDFNTFIGYASGAHNVTGNSNICIGGYAGGHPAAANNSNCTFIGTQSGPWTGTDHANPTATLNNLTNATAIGNRSKCTVSNALVLGGVDADAVKVGIGIHNPQYPLDVKGVVNMRTAFNAPSMKINDRDFMGIDQEGEFWVSNFKMKYADETQWADKVFDKNYKLLKISELESFVFKNKHLPNIPSAKEVVEKGVDNTEMTSKLFEKIEELSLYIIQLEKRISTIEKNK